MSRSKQLNPEYVRINRGILIFGHCCGSQTRAPGAVRYARMDAVSLD